MYELEAIATARRITLTLIAKRLLPIGKATDDLMQEAGLIALASVPQYDPEKAQLWPFLYQRVRGHLLDYLNKERANAEGTQSIDETWPLNAVAEQAACENDFFGAADAVPMPVGEAIENNNTVFFDLISEAKPLLTAKQHAVLVLLMAGHTAKEIAEQKKSSISSVRRTLRTIIDKLREKGLAEHLTTA